MDASQVTQGEDVFSWVLVCMPDLCACLQQHSPIGCQPSMFFPKAHACHPCSGKGFLFRQAAQFVMKSNDPVMLASIAWQRMAM